MLSAIHIAVWRGRNINCCAAAWNATIGNKGAPGQGMSGGASCMLSGTFRISKFQKSLGAGVAIRRQNFAEQAPRPTIASITLTNRGFRSANPPRARGKNCENRTSPAFRSVIASRDELGIGVIALGPIGTYIERNDFQESVLPDIRSDSTDHHADPHQGARRART
jgi:hypothetical protein